MVKLCSRCRMAGWLALLGLCLSVLCIPAGAQSDPQKQAGASGQSGNQAQQQNIPDAPSASRPAQPFPGSSGGSSLPSAPQPQPSPNQTPQLPPIANTPVEEPPATEQPANSPPPHPEITTVPPGGAPNVPSSPRDQLYTYTTNVNFVVVPVTVKDDSGTLVEGLLPKDFTVYENGVKQQLKFFTSDPFPLSAAVIIDTGVPSTEFRKVKESLTALEGAFSKFDEVSLYTYSNVVQHTLDFTAVNRKLDATLAMLRHDDRVVLRYVDNPNGSLDDIAGICSEKRNVMGMMPHPERAADALLGSTDGKVILESMIHSLSVAAA